MHLRVLIESGCGVIRLGGLRYPGSGKKRNNESGSSEPETLCRELRNYFLANKSEIVLLWIVASVVGNGASGASLTSALPNFS